MSGEDFRFTQEWFVQNAAIWDKLIPRFPQRKILEIGSFEGRATCYFIETCAREHPIELHCIDTWEGGVEHDARTMPEVEPRFDHNVALAQSRSPNEARVVKHKCHSHTALAKLIAADAAGTFDIAYIDGSHTAPDVLTDAVMVFKLLRVGGLMIFDDYLWSMERHGQQDPFNMPKPAVDAFVNIFQRRLYVVQGVPVYQLFVSKTSD